MKKEDLKICGVLDVGMGFSPIYYIENEGALVYQSDIDGVASYISNVAVKGVHDVDPEALEDAIAKGNYGDAIGVALLEGSALVIIDAETAERRPYYAVGKSAGQPFSIDLDTECESVNFESDICD